MENLKIGDSIAVNGACLTVVKISGSAFTASVTLCITTACKDKAGAWAFIRSTLSEEYQKNLWNFPILKSAFEANAKEAMTQEYETDADGNQISKSYEPA